MKTCPFCRAEVEENTNNIYCPSCGNIIDENVLLKMKIEKELQKKPEERKKEAQRREPERAQTKKYGGDDDYVGLKIEEEKSPVVKIVIGVIALALAAAAVWYFL